MTLCESYYYKPCDVLNMQGSWVIKLYQKVMFNEDYQLQSKLLNQK